MKTNKTVISVIELKPEEVNEIIKAHLTAKGFEVNDVEYCISTKYSDSMDSYGTDYLSKVKVTSRKTESIDL